MGNTNFSNIGQLNGEDWTWNNLKTLCWEIGSISGSMMEDQAPNLVSNMQYHLYEWGTRKEAREFDLYDLLNISGQKNKEHIMSREHFLNGIIVDACTNMFIFSTASQAHVREPPLIPVCDAFTSPVHTSLHHHWGLYSLSNFPTFYLWH